MGDDQNYLKHLCSKSEDNYLATICLLTEPPSLDVRLLHQALARLRGLAQACRVHIRTAAAAIA